MASAATLILRLNARRAELVRHLEHVADAIDDAPPKGWDNRDVGHEGDDVLEAMDPRNRGELHRIDAALERYAAGEYGICTTCGRDVAPERLLAVPETPFCATCAR